MARLLEPHRESVTERWLEAEAILASGRSLEGRFRAGRMFFQIRGRQ